MQDFFSQKPTDTSEMLRSFSTLLWCVEMFLRDFWSIILTFSIDLKIKAFCLLVQINKWPVWPCSFCLSLFAMHF